MIEQIELIRKDLDSLYEYRQDDFNYIGCHNDIIRHLNSIEKMSQNILKYKTMWEELKQSYEKVFKECKTENDYIICGMSGILGVLEFISELEQKHGIGVE